MNNIPSVVDKTRFAVERRWPLGKDVGMGQVLNQKTSQCNHLVVVVGVHWVPCMHLVVIVLISLGSLCVSCNQNCRLALPVELTRTKLHVWELICNNCQ